MTIDSILGGAFILADLEGALMISFRDLHRVPLHTARGFDRAYAKSHHALNSFNNGSRPIVPRQLLTEK